jgi:ketopantoate reductase
VLLSGTSGITASTRQPIGVIRDDKDMRAFLYQLMRETIAVVVRQASSFCRTFKQN